MVEEEIDIKSIKNKFEENTEYDMIFIIHKVKREDEVKMITEIKTNRILMDSNLLIIIL